MNESFVSWSQWEEGSASFIHSFIHSWGVQFFSWVFPMFPMCSHHVPMGFPSCFSQDVPNSTSHLSHWTLFSPKVQLSCMQTKEVSHRGIMFVSILQLEVKRDHFDLGVLNVTKNLMMGQSIWLLQPKIK